MPSSKNACLPDNLPPLRQVIADYDLQAKKSLGQNFLLDQNITDKIVRLCGDLLGLNVVEIGPGPGGLTRSLLNSGAGSVTAVEFDNRAIQALESLKTYAGDRLNIMEADALAVNVLELVDAPRAIIANLPYNIATPLLIGWLKDIRTHTGAYDMMALMFQKEVVERITAHPGTKSYGRLSVMSQWLCETRSLTELPPSVFTPPPKIHSAVALFKPRTLSDDAPKFETMEKICALAFNQRRKMIRGSLKAYLPQIEVLGIDPTLRAEQLGVSDFINIAMNVERS